MKVVFINAYDTTGGAGIAAHRLYEHLQQQYHLQSTLLVGTKRSHNESVIPTVYPGVLRFIERSGSYLLSKLGLQYKFLPFSRSTILSTIKRIQPDIIHLHNIHGGYFQTSLLRELSKYAPIVWTLHDMWAFTANAAHTFGNQSWKTMGTFPGEKKLYPPIGLSTGKWLLHQKKKIYSQSRLTFVTPSLWLYNLAVQSPVVNEHHVAYIPNGIDTNRYAPRDRSRIRKLLNIPSEAKALFFSSEKLQRGEFKGGHLLSEILFLIHEKIRYPIYLIMIGEGNPPQIETLSKFIVHSTGYIRDEEKMIDYINAADCLLYPTKADNLPNVLIESISCGIPAITFDIGGCGEIIKDNKNGFVVPPFDKDLFASRVVELLTNDSLRKNFSVAAREHAEEHYSLLTTAEKYHSLYRELNMSGENQGVVTKMSN